jgi:hypothetical protein
VRELPVLRDVDLPGDADAVAAEAPDTRFATLHRRLGGLPGAGVRPDGAA